jgi:hypothetical protein
MISREESRVCLDHYKSKVVKIRAARDQASQRGKSLSRYESEWLDRNERKLEKARLEFQVREVFPQLIRIVNYTLFPSK